MHWKNTWTPSEEIINASNIFKMMELQFFETYEELYQWSVKDPAGFWRDTMDLLEIKMEKKYDEVLDLSKGVTDPVWLKGAEMNIVDSCFRNYDSAKAIIYKEEGGEPEIVSHQQLVAMINQIANGLVARGLKKGDYVAIDMPMNIKSVAIYLAIVKAGMVAVTIADSFAAQEIKIRLEITKPKLLFTQENIVRGGKTIPLYDRVVEADAPPCVVIKTGDVDPELRSEDQLWENFISSNTFFKSVSCAPSDPITILFSSGTTGTPKAIPWDHTTPIKCAGDGYFHQNIQNGDVVCWPTNLGWMMGPWLVFTTLITESSMALYGGSPLDKEFGAFVEQARVTMLGVVPSLVSHWKNSGCMESLNWSKIKTFSSTGEVSNPEDMQYLMNLAGNKPVIEYCGGTEIGGGYISGAVMFPAAPGTFTMPTLGTAFVLLDENNEETDNGEVFIIPPTMGLSTRLLNQDHDQVYYQGTPVINGKITRRHGDRIERLPNGYFRGQGRTDDAMNLGGIKVSSVQIEEILNSLDLFKETAAVAVPSAEGGPANLVIYGVEKTSDLSFEEKLQAVQKAIKEQLNPLFKAEDLVLIDHLPRTASNKVMRRKLRELYKEERKTGQYD
ncbi:AMP-binding protein [Fulvivirgaceae bacterium BMA12]|uniref:AMP-binding protein n=1 Tax=Agaribacillus aureus TaxID=3051825 RepID=A0ABT8LC43_9BACT|nr:AMP-binding protein [Fulvivirgaceae bacterium BMA12]